MNDNRKYLDYGIYGVQDRIFRKIENATFALHNCTNSGSEWGIKYWTQVVNALHRKGKDLAN
jgi:hypothetical protein